MIKLYQFPPAWGVPNLSPPCMKVETYLRMAGLEFESITRTDNIRKAPKGKLPFIEDRGQKIADSTFILEYLKQTYGDPLDQHLTDQEKAVGWAFKTMFEEHLYWVGVSIRWNNDQNFSKIKTAFFDFLPPLVKDIFSYFARKALLKQLYGQGLGRHSHVEIQKLGQWDLEAISKQLSGKSFILGDQPTSFDATIYAFLANFLLTGPIKSPVIDYARSLPNLEAYCQRMKQRFYRE